MLIFINKVYAKKQNAEDKLFNDTMNNRTKKFNHLIILLLATIFLDSYAIKLNTYADTQKSFSIVTFLFYACGSRC